ncbi:MAG: tagaturonate epimerase family protein [Spirochaetota bacterium]
MTVGQYDISRVRVFLDEHLEHRPSVPHGPGLGLGNRMGAIASTSAMLAIEKLRIEGSAIQGSVFRELAPGFLGKEVVFIEYKGIGKVPVGHTGMTIEEQFVESVRDRIKNNITIPYCADADHIPLRGSSEDALDEFYELAFEARDRNFFTIDAHFCIDENAPTNAAKYRILLDAIKYAANIVSEVRENNPYVIELSMDECSALMSEVELAYILKELARAEIKLFSVAPPIGFDKTDVDPSESLDQLYKLLVSLSQVARDYGTILGIHSGDGKSDVILDAIGDATDGNVWYKISPDRQRLFFRLLAESLPGSPERLLFETVFHYLISLLKINRKSDDRDLAANSQVCLEELASRPQLNLTSDCKMMYHFCFLAAKEFKNGLKAVGDDFIVRYRQADFLYIANLAERLALI